MLIEINSVIKLAEEMKLLSEEMLNLKDKRRFLNLTTIIEESGLNVEDFTELITGDKTLAKLVESMYCIKLVTPYTIPDCIDKAVNNLL